jgi:predicted nucleic acid-binding protein
MNIGYIDSSFLLSLIFKDDHYEKAVDQWNELDILLGSILLEIESRINIYKFYLLTLKNEKLYKKAVSELRNVISGIEMKTVDREILLEIKNVDQIKRLKSLDSIHLATANIFAKLTKEKLVVCSFDKNINKTAKELGLKTIAHN